jgi:hypothetical protein
VLQFNGAEVERLSKKPSMPITISNGRTAVVGWTKPFLGPQLAELKFDDETAIMTTGKTKATCRKCNAFVQPYDHFCDGCGNPLPTAIDVQCERYVKEATRVIKWLAVIFVLFGVIMFFTQQKAANEALQNLEGLEGLEASMPYPEPFDGVTYNVGELLEQIEWEVTGVLVINLIRASIMVTLLFWAKRAPLPAILVAAATYGSCSFSTQSSTRRRPRRA